MPEKPNHAHQALEIFRRELTRSFEPLDTLRAVKTHKQEQKKICIDQEAFALVSVYCFFNILQLVPREFSLRRARLLIRRS